MAGATGSKSINTAAGSPSASWMAIGTPSPCSSAPRSFRRREFIFLFDPDRADANRGISSLAHGIANARDVIDIMGYEKIGVKRDAAIGGVIKTFSGTAEAGELLYPGWL
jgi:hypothetical protein